MKNETGGEGFGYFNINKQCYKALEYDLWLLRGYYIQQFIIYFPLDLYLGRGKIQPPLFKILASNITERPPHPLNNFTLEPSRLSFLNSGLSLN